MYVLRTFKIGNYIYTQFTPKEAEAHKLYLDSFMIASSILVLSSEMCQVVLQKKDGNTKSVNLH